MPRTVERLNERLAGRDSSRIVVLDYRYGDVVGKVLHHRECTIRIDVVVVRHLFAVKHTTVHDRTLGAFRITIDVRGNLVRILTVPKLSSFNIRRVADKFVGERFAKIRIDRCVIRGRVTKRLHSELRAGFVAERTALRPELLQYAVVVARIGHYGDVTMVFRCGPNHRGSADVDVFYSVFYG